MHQIHQPPARSVCCVSITSTTSHHASTHLQRSVLRLDRDDLISNQLQDPVHHRLKALQNLLVCKGHVAFLDAGFGELGFDPDIHRPLLPVVPEVGFYPILKVHDTFGVNLTRRFRPVRQLHLADLGAEDVGEVPVQGSGATRITRPGGALGDREGRLFLDLVRDQIDGTATAVHDKDRVVDLQVQQPRLGAEHGRGFRLGDQREAVVILVAQEAGLDGRRSCRSFAGVVPDGGHGQKVPDVALFSVEDLTQALLQLVAHGLSQLEQIIGGNIDFGLSWGKWGQVDGINVGVATQHELQLEPFDLLHAGLGVACGGERFGDVRTPPDDLLVLVVVEDGRDLQNESACDVSGSEVRAYFLLRLRAGAWPFDDDVLFGFGVGRESERNARERGTL